MTRSVQRTMGCAPTALLHELMDHPHAERLIHGRHTQHLCHTVPVWTWGNAPHETFDRSVSVQHQEAYPLSPIQHGMLFHHLRSPHAGVDIEQMVVTLRKRLIPSPSSVRGRL